MGLGHIKNSERKEGQVPGSQLKKDLEQEAEQVPEKGERKESQQFPGSQRYPGSQRIPESQQFPESKQFPESQQFPEPKVS